MDRLKYKDPWTGQNIGIHRYVSRPFDVKRGQMLVKTVKSGSNRAKLSEYIQYAYVSTQNFVKNSNSRLFEVKLGHIGIKLG